MKAASPLAWGAQVAAHQVFVIQRQREVAAAKAPRSQPTERSARNREALLHSLRDGRAHPFAEIAAGMVTTGLSRAGMRWLLHQLIAEGRVVASGNDNHNRRYRLA